MSKQLRRDTSNNMIGGVCSGLGKYFEIDPVVMRILFLLSFVFFGIGPIVYLILWLIVPAE